VEDDVEANGLKTLVDIQHGTRVEGSLHSCTKGYYSSKGFCYLKVNICCYILYIILYIFLLCKLKINSVSKLQMCVNSWVY
jgi:hypothetical protein